jgi:hypothetical protein
MGEYAAMSWQKGERSGHWPSQWDGPEGPAWPELEDYALLRRRRRRRRHRGAESFESYVLLSPDQKELHDFKAGQVVVEHKLPYAHKILFGCGFFSKHIVEQSIDARLEEFNADFHGSPHRTGRNG